MATSWRRVSRWNAREPENSRTLLNLRMLSAEAMLPSRGGGVGAATGVVGERSLSLSGCLSKQQQLPY